MMRRLYLPCVFAAGLLLAARPSSAQEPDQSSSRAVVSLSPHVAIVGELGRVANLVSLSTDQQAIDDNVSALAQAHGAAPTIFGSVPAIYGTGGVRFSGATRTRIRPYAEAGFGFAHVINHMLAVAPDGTNVSSRILTTPLTAGTSQLDPLFSFGGGISISAGKRAGVEIGYSYSHLLLPDTDLNTGRWYGAVRVGL